MSYPIIPFFARCVNNKGFTNEITIGKIYKIVKEHKDVYNYWDIEVNDKGAKTISFNADRFTLTEESINMSVTVNKPTLSIAVDNSTQLEIVIRSVLAMCPGWKIDTRIYSTIENFLKRHYDAREILAYRDTKYIGDGYKTSTSLVDYSFAQLADFIAALNKPLKEVIKVKLNETYTAEIHADKVVVGCQDITFGQVEDIWNAIQKQKD